MSLSGKTALVTGGGRGIGRASATALANQNAAVAVLARTRSDVEDVAETIVAMGRQAVGITCDVTNEDEVTRAFDEAEQAFGGIDIVVHSAGVMELAALDVTTLEQWRKMVSVNLDGAFLVCREALRRLKGRGGSIINIGSLAGRRGYAEQGAYCSTKHGLAGLTKVLAIEGQSCGVRVHLVSPGGVLTGLSDNLRNSRAADPTEWMTPEEVADAVVFCAAQTGVAITDEIVLRRYASEPWR